MRSLCAAHYLSFATSSFRLHYIPNSVYTSRVADFSSASYSGTRMSRQLDDEQDLSSLTTWNEKAKQTIQPKVIIPLSPDTHKGSSGGRLAVLGGSQDYTGAPYYAAMAALQTGADLVYVWTAQEATLALKSYSPEIMVSSVYAASEFAEAQERRIDSNEWTDDIERLVHNMVTTVVDLCLQRRLHALVIGPGLGRDVMVLEAVKRIVLQLQFDVAMVLDADALYMLTQNDNAKAIFGDNAAAKQGQNAESQKKQRRIILTPNVMEYKRLFGDNPDFESDSFSWARDLTILEKGRFDLIRHGTTVLECQEEGGLKRSGGIGDILSGCTGTLLGWQALIEEQHDRCRFDNEDDNSSALAAWTACCFVKRATKRAFQEKRRAMTAPDILAVLGVVIDEMTWDED